MIITLLMKINIIVIGFSRYGSLFVVHDLFLISFILSFILNLIPSGYPK